MKKGSQQQSQVRGIRGAIQVEKNERSFILKAAQHLVEKVALENQLEPENIVSIFFTTTKDINADFPASVLREIGWKYVPALCSHEMDVPKSMPRVIRILVHAYVKKSQKEIKHQYLGETIKLRPDL